MSGIMPIGNKGVAGPEGFSRRESTQLQAATNREVAKGIVINTRLSVAHFAASAAVHHTASLYHQAETEAGGDELLGQFLVGFVGDFVAFGHAEMDSLRRMQ